MVQWRHGAPPHLSQQVVVRVMVQWCHGASRPDPCVDTLQLPLAQCTVLRDADVGTQGGNLSRAQCREQEGDQ